MLLVVCILVLVFDMSDVFAAETCDKLGILLYEDMACKMNTTNSYTGCPETYICPHLDTGIDECYYKDQIIQIGDSVNHSDVYCDIGCFCSEGANFECAILSCIEFFGGTPSLGCYTTYSLEKCCSVGQNCGESNVTCKYGSKTYKEGEKFFPEDSCSMCVCQKGFQGKIEAPFCTRRKCNVQLKRWNRSQDRCAPVYNLYNEINKKNGLLCCPDEWICPDGTENIIGDTNSSKTNCDKLGVLIYEDMGCKPTYSLCSNRCPKLFTCPNLHESIEECYYKNQTLRIGDSVSHSDQFCDVACFCDEGSGEGAKFVCAVMDCATDMGFTPPPGCYSIYDLKRCCSVGEICESTTIVPTLPDTKVTCEYGGITYKEGIRFFPSDTCAMCVCQAGFRGKIEAPFCRRRICNVQLKDWNRSQQKCAPVYNVYGGAEATNGILCCPVNWICPDGTEQILGNPNSNQVCSFGSRTLKVGQYVKKSWGSVPIKCKCQIPPLLSCTPN